MKGFLLFLVAVVVVVGTFAEIKLAPSAQTTSFEFDLSQSPQPFPHYWEKCVGSGHAALGMREDWRTQMSDSAANLGWEYVRMHGILDDDMSVMIDENTYSFYDIDNLYDYLLSINVRPVVELRFVRRGVSECACVLKSRWSAEGLLTNEQLHAVCHRVGSYHCVLLQGQHYPAEELHHVV
jgi:hypothetical protein